MRSYPIPYTPIHSYTIYHTPYRRTPHALWSGPQDVLCTMPLVVSCLEFYVFTATLDSLEYLKTAVAILEPKEAKAMTMAKSLWGAVSVRGGPLVALVYGGVGAPRLPSHDLAHKLYSACDVCVL